MAEKVKFSEFIVQCAATFCICFLACQTGFVCAWPSYTTALFTSNYTVLSEPMDTLQISLLGGLPNLGGLLICPFCSYAFNTFGRKYASMLFGLPYVIAWTIISLTTNATLVLVAMAIAGVGIAGQNVSMIYISEISHDSIRGGLSACSASGYFLGLLISHMLGGYLSYTQVVHIHLTLSVVAIGLLMLLKESPVYYVLVGKYEDAAKSIAFYRRLPIDSKEVEDEISKIKLQINPKLEQILEESSNLEATKELLATKEAELHHINDEPSWKFLLKSKSSQRALLTTLTIMMMTILMGCVVLQVYAEPLFIEAVPSMPSNQCAILVALDFLIASVVCVLVIDRCGRKMLLMITSVLSGICTLLLGVQQQWQVAPQWVTALLIYLYSFVYTTGAATIPFVLAAEVFLPEVRSFCNSIVMASVWIMNFITLVIFNPIVENYGLSPVFFFFSFVCFSGAVFGKYCVPETKGLSVTEIQERFLKTKKCKKDFELKYQGTMRPEDFK